jgi:TRAP-type mannitol/chloroaromatic compound transport system substrate-binding protein
MKRVQAQLALTPQIEIILTAATSTVPFACTVWQYPTGNVAQAVYNKEKIDALPNDVRKALEKSWKMFNRLAAKQRRKR